MNNKGFGKNLKEQMNRGMTKPAYLDFFRFFFITWKKSRDFALSDGDIVTFPMCFYVKVTFYIFL